MAEETKEELLAELNKLRAEKAAREKSGLTLKVSDKGAVSVYGLGRFPVTLYYEQWKKLLAAAPDIDSFLDTNKGKLKLKGD